MKIGNKEQQRKKQKGRRKRNVEEEFVTINIFDVIYFLKLWQPRARARTKRLRAGLTGLYYNVEALAFFFALYPLPLENTKYVYKKSICLVLLYTSFKYSLVQYIKEIYIFVTIFFSFFRMIDLYGSLACGPSDPEITFKKI